MNKRIFSHVTFWILYCIENSLFEISWIHSFLPDSEPRQLVIQAISMNLVFIPSKLFLSYFAIGYAIPKALNKNRNSKTLIFQCITAFLGALMLYRLMVVWLLIQNPSFYGSAGISYAHIFSIAQLFAAILDLGFISGIVIAIKLFRMQLDILIKEKQTERRKLETELKFLKNQLNPHFLFNTLNNIYSLARKKSDQAPLIILKLSKLLRFMLYETEKSEVSVADEIRVLEDYVEVEKIRFSNMLNISFNQHVDNESQQITPLILLPFIENAFKHGPGEMIENSYIHIDISLKNAQLKFSVENSVDPSGNLNNNNIGLTNVKRQLELLYHEFDLRVDNYKGYYKVNLFINLNSYAAIQLHHN